MDINEYHAVLFRMLTDFANICENVGIRYYLGGGTALGAIRHHGFIPWDDDVDLCIPRPDYQRLPELLAAHMPENYKLIYRENAQIYQLVDTDVPIEMPSDNFTLGNGNSFYAFIDLFPLDGVPSNAGKRKRFYKKILRRRFFFKLGYIQYCYRGPHHTKTENLLIGICKALHLEKLFARDAKKNAEKLSRTMQTYDYATADWVMASYGVYGLRDMYPKEVVGDGRFVPFESGNFRVFSQCETYLTQLYGDYMTPVQSGRGHLADSTDATKNEEEKVQD